MAPCTCQETLTTHLVKPVKSCTDAVETLTKCKKGEEKVYKEQSCPQLYTKHPSLPSGTYKLTIHGNVQSTYCHMGECCGIKSGWIRQCTCTGFLHLLVCTYILQKQIVYILVCNTACPCRYIYFLFLKIMYSYQSSLFNKNKFIKFVTI